MRGLFRPSAAARRMASALVVPALLLLGTRPIEAGEVTAFGGASGPGLASMSFNSVNTPSPLNDDVAGPSPNMIIINQKDFSSVDYIDMLFEVSDTGGPDTEYILREGVNNSTGTDWTDYHVRLGFGTGSSFVDSLPGDGLDFDAPDVNSPFDFTPFTSMTLTDDTIDVYDGVFPNFNFFNFSFPIDVPDGITSFTIRQLPTVSPSAFIPEPSTLTLAGVGLVWLSFFGRRRRGRT